MQTEPLITWSEPATELIGFISLFLANGAVGFRYAALARAAGERRGRRAGRGGGPPRGMLGLIGALVQAVLLVTRLPRLAERMHLTTSQLITTDPQTIARCGLLLIGVVGLGLAAAGRRSGWGSPPSGRSGRSCQACSPAGGSGW